MNEIDYPLIASLSFYNIRIAHFAFEIRTLHESINFIRTNFETKQQ